jgi:hypothetical protein
MQGACPETPQRIFSFLASPYPRRMNPSKLGRSRKHPAQTTRPPAEPSDVSQKILAALQAAPHSLGELIETLSAARIKPLQVKLLLS